MQLEWLGKYRAFIESLIFYVNIYGQVYTSQGFHDTSVPCSVAQIQVLEYILENEEKNQKMAEVANRLGISPSAFSKNVKKMEEKGLLERYRSVNNHQSLPLTTPGLPGIRRFPVGTPFQKILCDPG